MPEFIFHVLTPAELAGARADGAWSAPSLQTEGFVHCCFRHQLSGVLERYFRGAGELIVLELEQRALGRVAVECPPGVAEGFPHVYGPLPLAAVRRALPLHETAAGHVLPPELIDDAAREARELDALLASHPWYEHPEGPRFCETERNEARTLGLWLFTPGRHAAFHRVRNGDELWIAQRGRVVLHQLDARGVLTSTLLGLDVRSGEHAAISVPRDTWQAAELAPGEPFAMGANVCAPPFEFAQWELADVASLGDRWPQHRAFVERLAAR